MDIFLDELLDSGYENYEVKIDKQVTFEKLGIDKYKIKEILKDKKKFRDMAMWKIDNLDIKLPMSLNFQKTLQNLKRLNCYYKSKISGSVKSKSTIPAVFNINLEYRKSEAEKEVANLTKGIAGNIRQGKSINIEPVIEKASFDGENLNFKLKAEIDGIEIKIPTSINKKGGNPQFNGISFNNTKNNVKVSLQNLIDGTYIVI